MLLPDRVAAIQRALEALGHLAKLSAPVDVGVKVEHADPANAADRLAIRVDPANAADAAFFASSAELFRAALAEVAAAADADGGPEVSDTCDRWGEAIVRHIASDASASPPAAFLVDAMLCATLV